MSDNSEINNTSIHAMSDPKNPWGGSGSGRGSGGGRSNNPWGSGGSGGRGPGRGSGGGDMPPDIDELLRKAQQNLNDVLPGNFGGGKFILLALLIVIGVWALTGFYTLQPAQHGVITTFGQYTRTQEQPGLQYHLPWPVQDATVVDVENERRIQIGHSDGGRSSKFNNSAAFTSSAATLKSESIMLTGDENIIDINFVVLWKIASAKDYLFEIRDPEATIRIVAQSAMREVIGRTEIQPALTDARGDIQRDTRILMQQMLDEYKAGVEINGVQLQKVDPPQPVVDAFNEVQRARQEKEQRKNQAEAYRNDIIPRARGEAEKLRQQADAYKQEVVNRAKGDAQRFEAVYAAYKEAKDVTTKRIYLETFEEILQNTNNVIIDPSQKGSSILPYLPLDKVGKK